MSDSSLLDVIAKFIGTLGFPIAVSAFLLVSLPRAIDKIVKSQIELEAETVSALNGLRRDVQELSRVIEYTYRLRGYRSSQENPEDSEKHHR